MREIWCAWLLCAAAASTVCFFGANALPAQEKPAPEQPPAYPSYKVAARLHFQGYYFNNKDYAASGLGSAGPRSSFFTRRARIELTGKLSDHVSFIVQPSFENAAGREPNLRLRDAYIDVGLGESVPFGLKVRFGQEKRPFGRYELASANNLPSIERGAGRGLLQRGSNDLFLRGGFLSHDVGISVIARFDDRTTAQAGVYNGTGESFIDNNGSKSFGARVTSALIAKLNVGVSYFSHDAVLAGPAPAPPPSATDSSFRNDAFGLDAAWGKPGDPGLFVIADYMRGEALSVGAPTMSGFSLVGAYNVRLAPSGRWLYAIEPALRFDTADPDSDADDDASTLITAVLGFYMSSAAHFRIAYERQDIQGNGGPTVAGVRTAMTVHF